MHDAQDFLRDLTLQPLPGSEHWMINLAATLQHAVIASVRGRESCVQLDYVR